MRSLSVRMCWVVALGLIALQALFVAAYIGHEHAIYFWDHAMYAGMARQFYAVWMGDYTAGWAMFRASLAQNYNLIFALPSLIGFTLFGASRLVFILTNFFVFFLAYEFAVAFLLRTLPGIDTRRAILLSLGAGILTPPLWLPLLEGYPDIGAAACVAFATGLLLRELEKPGSLWRAVVTGLVLALAVLLRRHFIYPALALLITGGGFSLLQMWRMKKDRGGNFRHLVFYYGLCGLFFAAVLVVVAPDFVRSAISVDFNALYLSYRRPVFDFLYFLCGGFGVGLLLVTGGGVIMLGRSGDADKRAALFISVFVWVWLVLWGLGPDQLGHHYMLHAMPLFIAVGLAGWLRYAETNKNRRILISVLAVLLLANSAWALWFSPGGVWPNDNGRPGLLSAARPPVVRPDYDEWLRFGDYLRGIARPEDRIMVVGSSFVFNQDLLFHVYSDVLHAPEMAAHFPKSPEIDHEEPAPLDVFASSTIYLVAEPTQYHLDPGGQRVVTAAAKQFPPPADRANLFQLDKNAFHLADGVTVKIWRRKAWTPSALQAALSEIRHDGPADTNFIQDWAATAMPLRTQIRTGKNGFTSVVSLFDVAPPELDLFFMAPLVARSYRLALTATGNCAELHFHLQLVSGEGKHLQENDYSPATLPQDFYMPFTVVAGKDAHFLSLAITSAAASVCLAQIQNLRIEKTP